jgi:hypothetical protein
MNITGDDPEAQSRMTAFAQELGQLGRIADRNVRSTIAGQRATPVGFTDMPRSF